MLDENGDKSFVELVKDAYENPAKAGKLQFTNHFHLKRGPYDIISVMDENTDNHPYTIKGMFIDLYDPKLPVLPEKTIDPGTQALLYDLSRIENKKQPQVLAAAARIYQEVVKRNSYSFVAKSPVKTTNSMRVLLPKEAKKIVVTDAEGKPLTDAESVWDKNSNTYHMNFENSPQGIHVSLEW